MPIDHKACELSDLLLQLLSLLACWCYIQNQCSIQLISENNLEEDLLKASFQEVADSSGHLIVKRSPINVAKGGMKM